MERADGRAHIELTADCVVVTRAFVGGAVDLQLTDGTSVHKPQEAHIGGRFVPGKIIDFVAIALELCRAEVRHKLGDRTRDVDVCGEFELEAVGTAAGIALHKTHQVAQIVLGDAGACDSCRAAGNGVEAVRVLIKVIADERGQRARGHGGRIAGDPVGILLFIQATNGQHGAAIDQRGVDVVVGVGQEGSGLQKADDAAIAARARDRAAEVGIDDAAGRHLTDQATDKTAAHHVGAAAAANVGIADVDGASSLLADQTTDIPSATDVGIDDRRIADVGPRAGPAHHAPGRPEGSDGDAGAVGAHAGVADRHHTIMGVADQAAGGNVAIATADQRAGVAGVGDVGRVQHVTDQATNVGAVTASHRTAGRDIGQREVMVGIANQAAHAAPAGKHIAGGADIGHRAPLVVADHTAVGAPMFGYRTGHIAGCIRVTGFAVV